MCYLKADSNDLSSNLLSSFVHDLWFLEMVRMLWRVVWLPGKVTSTRNFGNLVKIVPISQWGQFKCSGRADQTLSVLLGAFVIFFTWILWWVFLASLPKSWDSLISSIEKMFFNPLMETALHKQNRNMRKYLHHRKKNVIHLRGYLTIYEDWYF